MARLIVKSPYIKCGTGQSAGGYLKYIATRERVEVIPDDRPPTNKQEQLLTPTDVTEELYRSACRVFDQLWDKKTPIRQIGVHTGKVQTDAGRQYNLFDRDRFDRLAVLNRTVDDIRSRFGEDSVMRASFLNADVSHMSGGLDKERRSGVTIGIDIDGENTRII